MTPKRLLQGFRSNPGQHRDNHRILAHVLPDLFDDVARVLRFDGQHHHRGLLDGVDVVGTRLDAGERSLKVFQSHRVTPRGADLLRPQVVAF